MIMTDSESVTIEQLPEDFMQHSVELFARLRAEGPVRQVVMPHGARAWLVIRYDDVRTLMTDPRISKDGHRMAEMFARHSDQTGQEVTSDDQDDPGFDDDLSTHMMNTDPPVHTRLRTLVSKAFTAGRMEGLRPAIERIADELLDAMAGESELDLITAYAAPLPYSVVADLLGVPQEDREAFARWATKLVGGGHDPDEVAEASRQLTEYAGSLIDAKRITPDDALVSALVQVTEDGDRLTRSELVAMIFLLVIAGSETPANQFGSSVYHLLTNPGELARLRQAPSLMTAAVEELLRYDGGVGTSSFRFTKADVLVGDVLIPADEMVVLVINSADRDSSHFPDADRLDLSRNPRGIMTFGHGIHYCVGAPLAKLMLEIGLSQLLTRYPRLRLAVAPDEVRWKNSTLVHGLVALPVRID